MVAKDETYNGGTNYATWGVALVLDNDQGTYNEVRQAASDFKLNADRDDNVDKGIWTLEESARYNLADWIKEYVLEMCEMDTDNLMALQVMQAGLADVDWQEIADNILSEDS